MTIRPLWTVSYVVSCPRRKVHHQFRHLRGFETLSGLILLLEQVGTFTCSHILLCSKEKKIMTVIIRLDNQPSISRVDLVFLICCQPDAGNTETRYFTLSLFFFLSNLVKHHLSSGVIAHLEIYWSDLTGPEGIHSFALVKLCNFIRSLLNEWQQQEISFSVNTFPLKV